MNYKKTNLLSLLVIYLFISASCREVTAPSINQEYADYLNNPIESKTPNSYSFEISAENNSSNYLNNIPVLQKLNLSLALKNYTSGTVHIKLINNEQIIIYNRIFTFGFPASSVNLDGLAPSQISLEFESFSGDFSLYLDGNP